jgi:hypothetical protein
MTSWNEMIFAYERHDNATYLIVNETKIRQSDEVREILAFDYVYAGQSSRDCLSNKDGSINIFLARKSEDY